MTKMTTSDFKQMASDLVKSDAPLDRYVADVAAALREAYEAGRRHELAVPVVEQALRENGDLSLGVEWDNPTEK